MHLNIYVQMNIDVQVFEIGSARVAEKYIDSKDRHLISTLRLNEAMCRQKVDKSELSKYVSISTQHLGRLISGKQDLANTTGRVLIELSEVLNVSPNHLLGLYPSASELDDLERHERRMLMLKVESCRG